MRVTPAYAASGAALQRTATLKWETSSRPFSALHVVRIIIAIMENDAIAFARIGALEPLIRATERILHCSARASGSNDETERHIDPPSCEGSGCPSRCPHIFSTVAHARAWSHWSSRNGADAKNIEKIPDARDSRRLAIAVPVRQVETSASATFPNQ